MNFDSDKSDFEENPDDIDKEELVNKVLEI